MSGEFTPVDLTVGADRVRIHGTRGGDGPPVLLLHGFPQTHAMWEPVAADLARDHTVVCTDLRGYGGSDRPESGAGHLGYSFRAMAADQVAVMAELGFDTFAVVGHDRGARVAHRMLLDHPGTVTRAALLDILPTAYVYGHVDRALATAYYHWFLFIQPDELPERLIAGDPIGYLHTLLGGWGSGPGVHRAEALASYERAFADPAARHAMMEDYRAGASIDLVHDEASAAVGQRIAVPTLVLWGEHGVVGANAEDPVTVWRRWAVGPDLVSGRAVPGAGHFLVDERPGDVGSGIRDFLTS
ncbi:alpha/beta fold hydrolase [Pseudonocardia sp. HH130630-07]|uniref:alpha/beta fold hydrolase n=1 Tax=Pseudonocardia sp. HH130630-07 TaxID=1690815 RepID=UPI0008152473|nr:alpha/beta hydrolase [Pseudonocardia sp. HH130630-07]ANY07949.1 alpha/beta hydrolase [Pseudonocardia sp. HH130630-07]